MVSVLDTEEEIIRMEDVARARRRDDQGGTPTCSADEASRRSLLAERRPADGNAAVRRSTSSGVTAHNDLGSAEAGHSKRACELTPDLLFAYHLLAWSEAIEDGDRRTFEEWGA